MARAPDQAKRVSILKAARTILLRDGYAAAKMSDIATEAGVAPGTLYLYFENKEALAGAIGEELLERVSSQFLRVIKNLDSPEGVLALLDWSLKVGRQERDVFAMMKQTKSPEKGPPPAMALFIQRLAETLAGFISKGSIRYYDDPVNLANIILAITHRMIMSCALYDDTEPERLKAAGAEVLNHALFDDEQLKRLLGK